MKIDHTFNQDFYRFSLGVDEKRIEERIFQLEKKDFLRKAWQKDPGLWPGESAAEIKSRLGWLSLPDTMREKIPKIRDWMENLKRANISSVVLIGMGGSSLAAELFKHVFHKPGGGPDLLIFDSTHPAAVADIKDRLELKETHFIVSSKSGTTLETISLFHFFWDLVGTKIPQPGQHFTAITDQGSPLDRMTKKKAFHSVFHPLPDVGGRFSAFTEFGLVPAALCGADIAELLSRGKSAAEANSLQISEFDAPGIRIGAVLGQLNLERNKLAICASPALARLGDWLEQLVAESTGKKGKGIFPVVNDPMIFEQDLPGDRIFFYARVKGENHRVPKDTIETLKKAGHPVIECEYKDKYDLGFDIYNWQVGISAAGSILGINPFDQPDVNRSKDLTQAVLSGKAKDDKTPVESVAITDTGKIIASISCLFDQGRIQDYICLQAFLPPRNEILAYLDKLGLEISKLTQMPATVAVGPRYLHSTGQIHKGGPKTGFFIQLVDESGSELPVPETRFNFRTLLDAQSIGDYLALKKSGQSIVRICLGEQALDGLRQLMEVFERLGKEQDN